MDAGRNSANCAAYTILQGVVRGCARVRIAIVRGSTATIGRWGGGSRGNGHISRGTASCAGPTITT